MQPMFKIPNPYDWVSVSEAAQTLKVDRATVYAMLGDGRLTPYKIGGTRVLWRPEVVKLAEALQLARPPR